MSRIGTLVGVFGLALFVASVASAQPGGRGPGGPGGFGGGMMGGGSNSYLQLLRLEQVQKDIELVDDQKTKIKELADAVSKEMRDQFSGMRDLSAEQRQAKMEEFRKKAADREAELTKKVEAILLPHQVKRLKEINIQVQGLRALQNAEVAKELGITEDQKAKMEAIRKEITDQFAKAREEMQNLSDEERRAKFREMGEKMRGNREETEKKILDILTPAQKEKFETMKGKKIEINMSQLFGGQGGQGGRRGARGGNGGGQGGGNN